MIGYAKKIKLNHNNQANRIMDIILNLMVYPPQSHCSINSCGILLPSEKFSSEFEDAAEHIVLDYSQEL